MATILLMMPFRAVPTEPSLIKAFKFANIDWISRSTAKSGAFCDIKLLFWIINSILIYFYCFKRPRDAVAG